MKKLNIFVSAIILGAAFGGVVQPKPTYAANQQMTVDLSISTGAIKHGATGFLYGLGDEGIPTDNMLAPIKSQGTAQKAPDGLQHPNGDALKIAPNLLLQQLHDSPKSIFQ